MSDIHFNEVRKVFGGGTTALESFSLVIPSPTLVVLVGPSGCGKTTLLRLIAGLERPTSGTITIGGRRLDNVDPRHRDVAMVFQNYALYPHMTVRGNLSFGLRIRSVDAAVIDRKVAEVARSLDIDALLDRRPAQLSGGQRQRVALGRAVIREPRVFLFDEPLSNLDARLRDEMRYLIKRLYLRLATTTVYVTHDQVEAMTIGEMLVVMRAGRIHQVGSPEACYLRPHDTFVATFLGSPPMNLLDARFDAAAGAVEPVGQGARGVAVPAAAARTLRERGECDIVLGVRPEDVACGDGGDSGALVLEGRVTLRETLGHDTLTHIELGGGQIVARGPGAGRATGALAVRISPAKMHFFSRRTGERVAPEDSGPPAAAAPAAPPSESPPV